MAVGVLEEFLKIEIKRLVQISTPLSFWIGIGVHRILVDNSDSEGVLNGAPHFVSGQDGHIVGTANISRRRHPHEGVVSFEDGGSRAARTVDIGEREGVRNSVLLVGHIDRVSSSVFPEELVEHSPCYRNIGERSCECWVLVIHRVAVLNEDMNKESASSVVRSIFPIISILPKSSNERK